MRLLAKTVAAKFITQTAHLMLQAAADVLKVRSALNAGFANHRFGLEVSRADGKTSINLMQFKQFIAISGNIRGRVKIRPFFFLLNK